MKKCKGVHEEAALENDVETQVNESQEKGERSLFLSVQVPSQGRRSAAVSGFCTQVLIREISQAFRPRLF